MNGTRIFAVSVALAAVTIAGCSGSDTPPVASNGPAAAAQDDQRTPQSDALTPAEVAQVNQAESEPDPAAKSDN